MTSAVKTFLIFVLVLPLLIYIGSEIGSDEYLVPTVVGVLLLVSLIFGLFFRGQRVECIVLMMLLGGYIIGNRGFAQLYVVQPLFIGELGMMAILAVMLFRYIVAREFVVAPHLFTRLIALYVALAVARLFFDWEAYGIDAPRDAAIVYYALFFFVAYQLGRREETAAFIDRGLLWFFSILAVVAIIFTFEPEWLDLVTIRGTSPLLQKPDITGTFCALGSLFVALRSDLLRSRWIRIALLVLLLTSMVMTGVRAAMVALCGALVLTWIAARRGFITLPAVLGVIGIVVLFGLGGDSTGRLASTRDELLSIVDVTGTQSYETGRGDEKQADNAFRRALWESIYTHTTENGNWIAGKGFGYNFIPDFELEYRAGSWDTLRSAHNYYLTVFGRLGILGFGLFAAVSFEIVRHGIRAALALRRKERYDTQSLAYWCSVWAILISGTFGVVLEGPMGAIPFWSMLGFAVASDDRFALAQKAAAPEPVEEAPEPRWMPPPQPARVG